MVSIEILDSLYMNPGKKIGLYETEKSHIALWSYGSSPLPPSPPPPRTLILVGDLKISDQNNWEDLSKKLNFGGES